MDNELLVLLSKFSVAARKVIGPVNPAKIVKDQAYAKQVFEQADAIGEEDLLMVSLELQNKLGYFDEKAISVPTPKKEEPATVKYLFGARG
jgi:Skp family chaperone for outer membrane proteins